MIARTVRLIPLDEQLFARLKDEKAFAECHHAEVPAPHRSKISELVRMSLDFYAGNGAVPPWIGYLAVDAARDVVVGTCGFKGNPSAAGEVEIAYYTSPDFEGRGFATATARALTELAERSAPMPVVIAHTLPERNASAAVLTKLGFHCLGEVQDPEDGTVWKWRRDRTTTENRSAD